LRLVRRWTREWLLKRQDIYQVPRLDVDYPPFAIVFLSPLSLGSDRAVVIVWLLFQLMLIPVAAYLATRLVRPHGIRREAFVLTLMFAGWGGVRAGLWSGQVALLVLVLGLAAVIVGPTRPIAGGFLMAGALVKPHIALPFLVWAGRSRRLRVVCAATAVVAGALGLYCLVAREGPIDVITAYVKGLAFLYWNPAFQKILIGDTDLREVVRWWVSSPTGAEFAYLGVLVVLALFVWALISARYAVVGVSREALSVAGGCLFALLAFFNLRYNLVMLLPVIALLRQVAHLAQSRRLAVIVWAAQALLVLDIPWVWRTFLRSLVPDWLGRGLSLLTHVDRFLVLGLLFTTLWAVRRTSHRAARADCSEFPARLT